MTRNVPVAIIGMGCFFPKSPGIKQYWRLLYKGEDAVSEVPLTHWSTKDYFDEDPNTPDHVYCKRGGFLSQVSFDPTEFGIPPASLEATDTSQLLGLIAAKMALENAGYHADKEFDRSKVSVILGATGTQELVIPLGARLGHPHWRKALNACGITGTKADEIVKKISESYVPWQENSFPGLLGNVIAGRICNRLDLGGTNCAVDAACASSMSAIHLAVLELVSEKSDMVVTGGIDTLNDIFMHMCFAKTRILSPTGDARPFSKDADGTVLGEGIGMIVLKRLVDAQKHGDRIYAVIKGIGSSSDGKSQSIYAPRSEGQMQALNSAYVQAGIDPSTVELVEAHGTGTRVGDLVEFQALSRVFQKVPENHCALGSVKSNIGHTKAAAGAAGMIKAVLALHHKVLPPTLKADTPDPALNIHKSPFYLNTRSRPWLKNDKHPRRAGVSAFGFGGSNFHVVLEEYEPKKTSPSWQGSVDIFALSSFDRNNLEKQLHEIKQSAEKTHSYNDIAHAALKTRNTFSHEDPYRLLFPINPELSFPEQVQKVHQEFSQNSTDQILNSRRIYLGGPDKAGKLAFVFPGQGSQYVHMGCDLICTFPEALERLEKAELQFRMNNDLWSLTDYLYPKMYNDDQKSPKSEHDLKLRQTHIAQPAIGAVSFCLSRILNRFNVSPEAVCGHSFGELTALWSAGRISDEDFLLLSVHRGRLMAKASDGRGVMTAVKAHADKLEKLIQQEKIEVIVANKNSREQTVLSGLEKHMAKAESICREKGFVFRRLPVSAAFHTPMMKDARDGFYKLLSQVSFKDSRIPIFSNTTGKTYPDCPEDTRNLLANQIVFPVDFVGEIESMVQFGARTFLEVGPGKVLTNLIQAILKDYPDCHALSIDHSSGKADGCTDLAHSLCYLAAIGHPVKLDQWEQPLENNVRKQKMSVAISGANIRVASKKIKQNVKNGTPKARETNSEHSAHNNSEHSPHNKVPVQDVSPDLKLSGKISNMSKQSPNNQQRIMNDRNKNFPDQIQSALKVVQDGMKSMQALQMQTAETHKKFLETQTETGRMLQQMMAHTQRLAETAMGSNFNEIPAQSPACHNNRSHPIESQNAAIETENEYHPPAQNKALEKPQSDRLKRSLLSVVSELTGYPPEMLDLDMDIESDLGIDSIKRVEILSALEEKIPDLPSVSPEQMGRLKTLGQVMEQLTAGDPEIMTDNPEKQVDSIQKTGVNAGQEKDDRVTGELLSAVSEMTGYPVEMLGMDMDIESDLGIDSIKRVEILSALEERLPGIPHVSPEIMGKLKTLEQIAAHLAQKTPEVTGSQNQVAGIQAKTGSGNQEIIEEPLLTVVSELTGYPPEMLGLDMDIESDLGIDSIKRVEILSALESRIPDMPSITPDQVGKLKTLGEILNYLSGNIFSDVLPPHEQHTDKSAKSYVDEPGEVNEGFSATVQPIERQVVNLEDSPEISPDHMLLPAGRKLLVAGLDHSMSTNLVKQFVAHNVDAECISMDAHKHIETIPKASGLVILGNHDAEKSFLCDALMLAKATSGDLQDSALESCALFATVSFMDGGFGFSQKGFLNPEQGGLAGLVKTAAREWSGVTCRALDIDPDIQNNLQTSHRIVSELLARNTDSCPETGLSFNSRVKPVLVSAPDYEGSLAIGAGDVVLVTGGARGITAQAALALAQETPATFILMGKSPLPDSKPEWLKGLSDDHALKKAVILNLSQETAAPTPAQVEQFLKKHKAAEEIRENIEKLARKGATVRYVSADICDENTVHDVMANIRAEFGPVKAVIHGAGVLEDRLIKEKTAEQFNRVYDTKVRGLKNVLKACTDPLSYLIFFSSVAGRFGNAGQADYAMANEVLNKMACVEALSRPDCRVVSINWGPWDGGMVTESIKKSFEARNIPLIPMESGGKYLVQQMRAPAGAPVEVVIGASISNDDHDSDTKQNSLGQPLPSVKKMPTQYPLSLSFKRELDLQKCPVLGAHILGGKPVVPFALMTEWLGCGALHENPGLVLQGLDNLHVLNGIKLEQDKKTIRLMAGKARKKGDRFEVDVEIRDGFKDGVEVIHSRAKAILGDELLQAPVFDKSSYIAAESFSKNMNEIYDQILFHGVPLQGIQRIISCSPEFMVAHVACAPSPEKWMENPVRSRWIADPLVLDCAFQMSIIWCFQQKGMVCLPSYSESYRQYRRKFPEGGITAVLEIQKVSQRKLQGDFIFLDDQDCVVAQLLGYEALMDPKLINAFR